MNILIVDDDISQAKGISDGFKAALPNVRLNTNAVTTAIGALEELRRAKYDVVLFDLAFAPGANPDFSNALMGMALLQQMKHHSPASKFVAYSSFADSGSEFEFRIRAAGADSVFQKQSMHGRSLDSNMVELLRGFLSASKPVEENPDTNLILPARQSILAVNTRLADIFRRDPHLLRSIDPRKFEELVAELFEDDGYRVFLTDASADGGKDLYVYKSDEKMRASFLVECKRYNPPNKVGVEVARQLYGVVKHEERSGGIIVTTSYFTRGAKEFADTVPYQLYLRDFENLQSWLQRPLTS